MTTQEFAAALQSLTPEQFKEFCEKIGGAENTIEARVNQFAYAADPAKFDRIWVFRLREVAGLDVRTEEEKLTSAAVASAAAATRSAHASESSAGSSKESAEIARESLGDARRARMLARLAVIVALVGVAIQALTYVRASRGQAGAPLLDETQRIDRALRKCSRVATVTS